MKKLDSPASKLEITDAMIIAKGLLMLEDALSFIQWVELPEELKEPVKDITIHTLEVRKVIAENTRFKSLLDRLSSKP